MILIVGGTGTLGREVVRRVVGSGQRVRVMSRRIPPGEPVAAIDFVTADLRDRDAVARAMQGCSAVVSAAHGFLGGRSTGPQAIDDQGNANVLSAAAAAGVEQAVILSVFGARRDHPLELHRAKFAAEEHARTGTVPWTILRPTAFLETWSGIVGAKVAAGGPGIIFGRGENPINFVSVLDVATVVEQSLRDRTLRGQLLDVTGPENLTLVELAQRIGATKTKHIPRAALAVMSRAAAPFAPGFARQAATARYMDTQPMSADPTLRHQVG